MLPSARPSRLPPVTRWRAIRLLFVVAVILLVGFSYAAVVLQRTAGAYIRGENLWSHAQKSAIIGLGRYAQTRDTADYRRAVAYLRIPRADAAARDALEGDRRDYRAATASFIAAGNDPADAPVMARMYPLTRHDAELQRAVAAWREGDQWIDSIAVAGGRLDSAVRAGDATRTRAELLELMRIDDHLTELEAIFSRSLAVTTSRMPRLVLALGFIVGLLVVAAALAVIGRLADAAQAAREAEHRRHEEVYALVESAPDSIVRYDRDRRILYVNAAFERMMRRPREQLLGVTQADVARELALPGDATTRLEAALDRAFAGEEVFTELVTPLPNGELGAVHFRISPETSSRGEIESAIVVGRDITALRESERTLRERDEQLRQSQKLEAVGQLAGGMAHEFNNILTVVIGNLELARDELAEEHPARIDVEQARSAAQRATGLTRQLLTFGRRQILEPVVLDVNAIVLELGTMLRRIVGERVYADIHPAADPAWVRIDPGQLQQVLLNLVVNARDAMPDGGRLTLDVIAPDDASREAREVRLVVRDSGAGMDDATRRRIFEPFFTTKGVGHGSGLGLAVVDGIVAQAGGRITVESAPGAGTAMTIHLPAAPAPAARPGGPTGEIDLALLGRGETVLLVEDEAPVRATARRMLERAGYAVIEAQHAEDAEVLWRRTGGPEGSVDCLITDLVMPGRNGVELLNSLRAERPTLPVLIVSGYTGSGVLDEQLGALAPRVHTLRKPFSREELLTRVRTALG